jgi:WD40 repeat protein
MQRLQPTEVPRSPGQRIADITFLSNEAYLAVSGPQSIGIWNIQKHIKEQTLQDVSAPFAVSRDDRILAGVTPDSRIRVVELRHATSSVLEKVTDPITAVAVSPDGRTVAAAVDDGTIRMWDIQTRRRRAVIYPHGMGAMILGFHPDGRTLLSASFDNVLQFWQVATAKELMTIKAYNPGRAGFIFSADGNCIALVGALAASDRGQIEFWRAPSFREIVE